ncbi:hypothetical protein CDAR_377611 [Caerostris darwini]|uniref:Uncharacterized protein n=1 Tax=Caerostris darwini TaxID=1538125 RepID=A0AAV4R0Z3_9ARAC|nr:hypothetical protein CDAR_377611 [Caerostris darwini]
MNGSSLNTWLRRPDDPGTNGLNVRERGREKRRLGTSRRCNSRKEPEDTSAPAHSVLRIHWFTWNGKRGVCSSSCMNLGNRSLECRKAPHLLRNGRRV